MLQYFTRMPGNTFNQSHFLRVGTLAIQVRPSAGTASIHLDVNPQRREHSWDGYVRYTKVFISFLFTREKPTTPKEKETNTQKIIFRLKCSTFSCFQKQQVSFSTRRR
jgi:hypothetical protein